MEREQISVRTFKTATIDRAGSLDLVGNRRILLTGVRPVARLADGQVLTEFEAEARTWSRSGRTAPRSRACSTHPDGDDVRATLTWRTTGEGLQARLVCEGAAAVGFDAGAPAQYVGGTVSVLGAFLPQRIPVSGDEPLAQVSRTLVGDPVGGTAGQGTLIAFVQAEEAPVATLSFLPSRDEGLLLFRHWVDGATMSLDLISDFTKQRDQADQALKEAKKLATSSPGRAIQELRNVANAFPFEETVRDEALELAARLEGQALEDGRRSRRPWPTTRSTGPRTRWRGWRRLRAGSRSCSSERPARRAASRPTSRRSSRRCARSARSYDVALAMPGVDRLERIAALLSGAEEYKPLAAVYWRTLLERYEPLQEDAPDIARRLKSAKDVFDELMKNPAVQEALPPVPEGK